MERGRLFSKLKRAVVKVGTASISEDLTLSGSKIKKIAEEIIELKKRGVDVIIVSSGAIAAGIKKLELKRRPRDINMLQAAAAVGQNELMKAYGKVFSAAGYDIAQILLTREDFQSRKRYLNIRNTINTLLKAGVIPIINENDSTAVDEIRFGDNDTLSALVASNMGADLLILMSSMDGLFNKDPNRENDAQKIELVSHMDEKISALKGKSRLGGVGGIQSKIKAANMMMRCGIPMAIVDASMENVLKRLVEGDAVGTVFVPNNKMGNKLQWILFSSNERGKIVIDEGAVKKLSDGKSSLLPPGIKKVSGTFKKGDLVKIVDPNMREFARGISNFSSEDLERIMGKHSRAIESILGAKNKKEIVYHDNLILIRK